jgi:hypothetical protein
MGINYYLYKPINHERYDLGKGSWRDVDFTPGFIYKTLIDNLNYDYTNQEWIDYIAWVAKDIIK